MSTQQCSQCQQIVEPDSNFCSSCGQKISRQTPDNQASNTLGTLVGVGVGLAGLAAMALTQRARARRQAQFQNPMAQQAQNMANLRAQMYGQSFQTNQVWEDAIRNATEIQKQANARQWETIQRGHRAWSAAAFGGSCPNCGDYTGGSGLCHKCARSGGW
jgi:type II secretory pathway pseudopilin PulG